MTHLDSHRKVLLHGQQLSEVYADVDIGLLPAQRQVTCVKIKDRTASVMMYLSSLTVLLYIHGSIEKLVPVVLWVCTAQ